MRPQTAKPKNTVTSVQSSANQKSTPHKRPTTAIKPSATKQSEVKKPFITPLTKPLAAQIKLQRPQTAVKASASSTQKANPQKPFIKAQQIVSIATIGKSHFNRIKNKYIVMDILSYAKYSSEANQMLFGANKYYRKLVIENYSTIARLSKKRESVNISNKNQLKIEEIRDKIVSIASLDSKVFSPQVLSDFLKANSNVLIDQVSLFCTYVNQDIEPQKKKTELEFVTNSFKILAPINIKNWEIKNIAQAIPLTSYFPSSCESFKLMFTEDFSASKASFTQSTNMSKKIVRNLEIHMKRKEELIETIMWVLQRIIPTNELLIINQQFDLPEGNATANQYIQKLSGMFKDTKFKAKSLKLVIGLMNEEQLKRLYEVPLPFENRMIEGYFYFSPQISQSHLSKITACYFNLSKPDNIVVASDQKYLPQNQKLWRSSGKSKKLIVDPPDETIYLVQKVNMIDRAIEACLNLKSFTFYYSLQALKQPFNYEFLIRQTNFEHISIINPRSYHMKFFGELIQRSAITLKHLELEIFDNDIILGEQLLKYVNHPLIESFRLRMDEGHFGYGGFNSNFFDQIMAMVNLKKVQILSNFTFTKDQIRQINELANSNAIKM